MCAGGARPFNPTWRSDFAVVLRQAQYHRVTAHTLSIGIHQQLLQMFHGNLEQPYWLSGGEQYKCSLWGTFST
jgi:hypothetical protein